MKVVVAHNHYGNFTQGGEAVVFSQEVELMRKRGIDVKTYQRTNAELARLSFWKKVNFICSFDFSKDVYEETLKLFREFQPDVLHVHNYKYVITPSIFQAAHDLGIPTVLSVHNYRLICPCGQLRRGDSICEECLQHDPIRILWRRGCASHVTSRFLQYEFFRQTKRPVRELVDLFLVPTQFLKNKMIEVGFDSCNIVVKPYCLSDPLATWNNSADQTVDVELSPKRSAIFVGRLESEKGVRQLIDAWRDVDFPLVIVGKGAEEEWIRRHMSDKIVLLGEKSHEETLRLIKKSSFLVFPSICYEGLGMTLLEAAALSVPVVASDLGGRREVVEHERTGLLYSVNDRSRMIETINRLCLDPTLCQKLGREARKRYERMYSFEQGTNALLDAYRSIVSRNKN